jgi:hypothetical protein
MKKTILLIQPGRLGDIILCLPIVSYYVAKGYEVDWYCPKEYHSMFRNISYCSPVDKVTKNYYEVIDLSFGFGGPPESWWQITYPRWDSFVHAKYHLAQVPLEEKWNLLWDRDEQREDALVKELSLPKEYIVYHSQGSRESFTLDLPKQYYAVEFKKQGDYNIFDWYKVLAGAKEIHCIDSVLVNFVDSALPEFEPKVFHSVQNYKRPDLTVKKGWIIK